MSSKEIYLSLYYLPPHLSRTGALRMLILFCILSPMRHAACKDKDSSKKYLFKLMSSQKFVSLRRSYFCLLWLSDPLKVVLIGAGQMPYWTPWHILHFLRKTMSVSFEPKWNASWGKLAPNVSTNTNVVK